ncbi:MAG: DUF354 domain-containing protein [archaeon]
MRIWIDLTNSPHVLFFEPLIKELKKNHKVIITARDYQQTIPLLKEKNIPFIELGRYHGKSVVSKILGSLSEIFVRIKFINKFKPDLSLSHHAQYSTIAAWITRKKALYIFDGDKSVLQMMGIFFAPSLCPENLPKKMYCINPIRYPGLKEEIYLYNFKPDKNYLKKIGIKKKKYNIFIRPEATSASYIKGKGSLNPLLKELEKEKDFQIIMVPRTPDQKEYYKKRYKNIFIPDKVVDGPQLISNVDLVISGGGTMNRESVVLGTPVLSSFQNDPLTIDKWLIKEGYMILKREPAIKDIKKMLVNKKKYKISSKGKKRVLEIIENILK